MSATPNDFTQSLDARDWAKAFVEQIQKNPSLATDESTILGWFANAIMRGYDEHERKERADTPSGSGAPPEPGCPRCGGSNMLVMNEICIRHGPLGTQESWAAKASEAAIAAATQAYERFGMALFDSGLFQKVEAVLRAAYAIDGVRPGSRVAPTNKKEEPGV